jgi:hypothetical protein
MEFVFVPGPRSEIGHAVVASESYGTDPGGDPGTCIAEPQFERYVHSLGDTDPITFELRGRDVDEAVIASARHVAEFYGRHVVLLKP